MRSRYPAPPAFAYSFGPGGLTPAIKILIGVNVVAFLLTIMVPTIALKLGLRPQDVFERGYLWQPITYMFLHGGFFHILFNMLTLWMFGVDLERTWGSRFFTRYYFICGVGAAVTMMLLALTPWPALNNVYYALTIGASGAVFGVLLAYGLYFPHRPILISFLFPVPAKYAVMIFGGISFVALVGSPGGGVAHGAHLGGLLAGYLYLKGGRIHLVSEIKYRYLKWRINRMRKKFDVLSGGRADDVNRRVH
jgi:membrane associated rhomboid family serine protease